MLRTRQIEVVAQDPSIRDPHGNIVTAMVSIPFEELEPGPVGYAVQVVDYDASTQTMYRPVRVPDDEVLPAPDSGKILSDPSFHAINAYALVMRTLHRFEFALGRRIAWSTGGHQLKVVPHAFEQANAYFDEEAEALVFGYVRSAGDPTLFGLSHDILVHETCHALLDGLRDEFTEASSPDQAALHEGFADIVALLSVFSLPEVLAPFIARLPSAELDGGRVATADERQLLRKADVSKDRLKDTVLFGLAEEIRSGSAEARVNALRRSVLIEPSIHLLAQHEFHEPHRRGEVLVSAVLNALLDAWVSRLTDPARTDSPLVSRQRVAEEGATIADLLLTMAIRAIDYTPPIHIEFGDYLSAMLTADREVRNDDTRYQLRDRLLTAFASFGILPASETADGLWKVPPTRLQSGSAHFGSLQTDRTEMFRLVWSNRRVLKLDPQAFTRITSLRPSFRVSPDDGFQIRETVVECTQYLKITAAKLSRYGLTKPPGMADEHELTLRGGSTLVLDEYGQLKYEIYNRIPSPSRSKQTPTSIARAQQRLDYAWNNGFLDKGASLTQGLAAFHRRRVMGLGMDRRGDDRTARQESWV